ncbi:MAG TPA: hypothetical protein DGU45_01895 [Planctomycetes bacterium]|nr:GldG family protein [Planctomycetota bacterium]HCW44047.1 hypothetical protein [Planctomycetota bacterium]
MIERKKQFLVRWTISLIVLSVLIVLVNGVSRKFDKRLDLTAAGIHTISAETGNILGKMEEPVTIEYWVSEKLPSGLQNLRRDTVDYLDEFKRAAADAGSVIEVKVIDPARVIEQYVKEKESAGDTPEPDPMAALMGGPSSPADTKKQELAREGIPELQGRSIKDDGVEVVPFFSAIVLKYLDREAEGIPVHTSLDGLEYELVSRIAKLALTEKPVLAFFQGRPDDKITQGPDGSPLPQPIGHFDPLLDAMKDRFDVQTILLTEQSLIPDTAQLLIIAEPDAVTPRQRYEIENSIRSGRPAIVLASTASGSMDRGFQLTPLSPGMSESFVPWGIDIQPNMIVSSQKCGSIETITEGPLGIRMRIPQPFPVCPGVAGNGLDGTSPFTRGVESLIFPFPSPLIINEDVARAAGIRVSALATSDEDAWVTPFGPAVTSQMISPPQDPGFRAPRVLALIAEGVFPSSFEVGSKVPSWDPTLEMTGGEADAPLVEAMDEKESRFLLIGSADMAKYSSLNQYRQNVGFLLGSIEALALDPDLAKIRGKVQLPSALRETTRDERNLVIYGNIAGIPLLLMAVYGLISAGRRSSARHHESLHMLKIPEQGTDQRDIDQEAAEQEESR